MHSEKPPKQSSFFFFSVSQCTNRSHPPHHLPNPVPTTTMQKKKKIPIPSSFPPPHITRLRQTSTDSSGKIRNCPSSHLNYSLQQLYSIVLSIPIPIPIPIPRIASPAQSFWQGRPKFPLIHGALILCIRHQLSENKCRCLNRS